MSSIPCESAVKQRYSAAATAPEAALCCPIKYDARYLEVIPREVIEKDYGCGDPSRHVHLGETVLDLGSGTGKICFIAAQIVGSQGKVIGVDMTDEMLEVARRNAPLVSQRLGFSNVEFRKGRIQDLALDLEELDRELKRRPITDTVSYLAADELAENLRIGHPLVSNESIDVVISNCVLNLVAARNKRQLFDEIFRVLREGGRAVISDIVSDKEVPKHLQENPELWSGCISGAFTECGFLTAFEEAGFYGMEILDRDERPWRIVEGIEFRSVTVRAFKGKQGESHDSNHAVIYCGPFKEVLDDDNHRFERGKRHAVSVKTYQLFKNAPYQEFFAFVDPPSEGPLQESKPFNSSQLKIQQPKETKSFNSVFTSDSSRCCDGGSC